MNQLEFIRFAMFLDLLISASFFVASFFEAKRK